MTTTKKVSVLEYLMMHLMMHDVTGDEGNWRLCFKRIDNIDVLIELYWGDNEEATYVLRLSKQELKELSTLLWRE